MALNNAKAQELARDAYTASTSYFDSSIRRQVEAAIRQFRGDHPLGSKYRSEAYATRSKLFRPKTRAMVTRAEATAAEAFFSTEDVVSLLPYDEDNVEQRVSAEINKALLQYRLTGKHPKECIPWYLTVIGAYQDAWVNGVVCSRQFWEHDPKRKIDRPFCELLPIENVRFDPNAKWVDVVNTSPYFIELVPMYVKDVRARVVEGKWLEVSDAQMLGASTQAHFDSTRQTRSGPDRVDAAQASQPITEYTLVWVHRNTVEWNGTDYHYYTLGSDTMLSKQADDITVEYWHGRRPYVVGFSAIEAHRVYPASPTTQTRDLQTEVNDVANLRLDNVKFILNKRYFVKRNSQVDLRSLTRNSVGSATLMKDPEKDVKVVDYTDVTSSSFNEQDRLNVEFDEVSGSFSTGSVQSNRKLNETVGGMNLLAGDSNQVSQYRLRTFVETWAEPVVAQLVELEQRYETDDVIMAIAGARSPLYQKHGQGALLDTYLNKRLNVSVNIGFGPTNPTFQLERFMAALRQFVEILKERVLHDAGIDIEEVKKEIFGKLGYRDGRRFFIETDNPEVAALQQQIQALEAQLLAKESPEERKAKVDKLTAETRRINVEADKIEAELAALGAGENPQVVQLTEQLQLLQQEHATKDADYQKQVDDLEFRLADRSEEIDSRARSDVERERIKGETTTKIAEINRERKTELDGFAKKIEDLNETVKALAAQVKSQPKPAAAAK